MSRKAVIERKTRETNIKIALDIDGKGEAMIGTGIGFLDHMLESFARHGLFDLEVKVKGDLHVDMHHTVEDAGIVLGQAFKQALGEKKGIRRVGHAMFPMDEALASAIIDISGRPYLRMDAEFNDGGRKEDFKYNLLVDFFQAFTSNAGITMHIVVEHGRSDHHKAEAIFKAVAKAMREACEIDQRTRGAIPSTKGVL
jgi:imidazoleglycerol-phosphate dehydratase